MGGGETKQETQSQNITQIPQWMQQAGQQNYALAQNVASRPLTQYQGQMVPDVAPQTQQFWNLAASSPDVGQTQFKGSTAGFLNSLGQAPTSVTPGQLSSTDLAPYLNPYTQDVIDKTIPIMQQQNELSQTQRSNAASAAGAFGNSKQGVEQGVAQAQGAQNIGQMVAQLRQAAYGNAQGAAQFDINSRLAADTGNQNAMQAKINSDILASQGLGNLGKTMNDVNIGNAGLLSAAGAGQSLQAQNQINSQIAKFNEARSYPQQQLATLLSALGMTPHDTASTGDQTTTTTTPNDWASILTGGLGLAGNVLKMSDKKVKKNIKSMGSDPVTGVPIKSFNYKGQPTGAPKVLGPLAQDVERASPGSTVKVGGVLALPKSSLAAATPSIAHVPSFVGNSKLASYLPDAKASKGALSNVRAGARAGGLANTKRRLGILANA